MKMMTPPLQELLRRAWEIGRRRWPQVDLPADVFIRHLTQVQPMAREESSFVPLLEKLDFEGLYLACACLNDVPNAVDMLEQHYMAQLPELLRHLKLSNVMVDEVCQMVRTHLLVGTPKGGPQLTQYAGRGSLMSWIHVIAVRMALRKGASVRETPDENALVAIEDFPATGTDPEMALIKSRYRHEFSQALREAFAALPSERYLLRLYFIDGLPTTKLGPLFGKDQTTLSRWLKEARANVYEETKRRLQERLQLTTREFESLMEAIKSGFDVSLSQVLNGDDDGEEDEED
jgi:RNA polymerase sigma-70 factor (ECF subfamily)